MKRVKLNCLNRKKKKSLEIINKIRRNKYSKEKQIIDKAKNDAMSQVESMVEARINTMNSVQNISVSNDEAGKILHDEIEYDNTCSGDNHIIIYNHYKELKSNYLKTRTSKGGFRSSRTVKKSWNKHWAK